MSKIKTTELVNEDKNSPPIHTVKHASITGNVKWVLKELKINPDYIKMKLKDEEQELENAPESLRETMEEQFIEEATALASDEAEFFRDTIAHEYMAFMSGRHDHARIAIDEKQQLAGKLSTFIDFKLWGALTLDESKSIVENFKKEYVAAIKTSYFTKINALVQDALLVANSSVEYNEEITTFKRLNDQLTSVINEKKLLDNSVNSLDTNSLQKRINEVYFKMLLQSPSLLQSFAQTVIFVHRLKIKDLHGHNIGIDSSNRFILFDAGRSLKDPNIKFDINKIPIIKVFGEADVTDELRHFLGEKYVIFREYIYRYALKEIICPDSYIRQLIDINSIPTVRTHAHDVKYFLAISKLEWEAALIQDEGFIAYLRKDGDRALKEILNEFKAAQEFHRHYANLPLLEQASDNYKNLISALPREESLTSCAEPNNQLASNYFPSNA